MGEQEQATPDGMANPLPAETSSSSEHAPMVAPPVSAIFHRLGLALAHQQGDQIPTAQSNQTGDKTWPSRALALLRLRSAEAPISVEAVLEALGDEDESVRAAAVRVLGVLGEQAPLEAMNTALADPSWLVREASALTLGELRTEASRALLPALLQDPDASVREAAQMALQSAEHPTSPVTPASEVGILPSYEDAPPSAPESNLPAPGRPRLLTRRAALVGVAAVVVGGVGFLWAAASHPKPEKPPRPATTSHLGLKGLPFYGPGYSAFDAQGQFFVMDADFSNRYIRILKLSPAGNLVAEQDFFQANVRPRSLTADEQGNLYVTMAGTNSVYTFSSTGRLLMQWAVTGSSPVGIVRSLEGNIYLTQPAANLIQKYSVTGQLLAEWGTRGNGPGQFEQPTTLALDGQGHLYITDSGNERIQKFTSAGEFITMWGSVGSSPGQFLSPGAITVDRSNIVYVTDGVSGLVQTFSSNGLLLQVWGKPGAPGVQFGVPRGVAIDAESNIYVSSADLVGETFLHGRVTKLAPDGTILAVWT